MSLFNSCNLSQLSREILAYGEAANGHSNQPASTSLDMRFSFTNNSISSPHDQPIWSQR